MRPLLLLILLGAVAPAAAQDRPSLGELAARVERTPDDAATRRALAERYTEAGEPARAVPHLEWLAVHSPSNVQIRRDLVTHLLWTEQPTRAAEVLAEIVALDPTDAASRLQLAQMITWTGGADRAVALLDPLAADRPDDAEVQTAYAYALHASGDEDAAREQYDRALALAPDNAGLLLESGALERWQGDWSVGLRRIARARRLGLDADDARRADDLLTGIERQVAPTVTTSVTQLTDSNALTRVSTPVQIGLTLNSRWSLGLGVAYDRLSSSAPDAAVPNADAVGIAPSVAYSPSRRLRLAASVGGETTPGGRVALRAGASAQRTWEGPVFAVVRLAGATASATDGVDAIDAGLRLSRLDLEGYLEAPFGLVVSAVATGSRYSDDNGRVQAGATLRQRTVTLGETDGDADPTIEGGVLAGALYEDTGTVYPDARPYYTPDQLTTLTGGLFGAASPGAGLAFNGDLGLIRQAGPVSSSTSVFYRGAASLTRGRHDVLVEVSRTGSDVYSSDTVTLRYQVRL